LYILMMKATSFDDKNNSLIVIYTIYWSYSLLYYKISFIILHALGLD
jgi:hypothetical protein